MFVTTFLDSFTQDTHTHISRQSCTVPSFVSQTRCAICACALPTAPARALGARELVQLVVELVEPGEERPKLCGHLRAREAQHRDASVAALVKGPLCLWAAYSSVSSSGRPHPHALARTALVTAQTPTHARTLHLALRRTAHLLPTKLERTAARRGRPAARVGRVKQLRPRRAPPSSAAAAAVSIGADALPTEPRGKHGRGVLEALRQPEQ